MKIRCIRNSGDTEKQAPITVPLACGNVAVMREAGRNAIDDGEALLPVTQDSVFAATADTGQVVGIYDALSGRPWKAIVTSVTHGMDESGDLVTRQTLLRKIS